jgi:hypothetical protein
MMHSSAAEASEVFAQARNLNAALKNLLKKESSAGQQVVSFAKDFRNAIASGKSAPRDLFIERYFESKEPFFIGAVRYAFPELFEASVGAVIDKYADTFNATYERTEQGIKITDQKRFEEIVKEVNQLVTKDIKAAELPNNNFIRKALLTAIFEYEVFVEVAKVL